MMRIQYSIKIYLFRLVTIFLILSLSLLVGELAIYILFREEMSLFPRYVTGVNYNGFKIRRNVPNIKYQHKSFDGEWEFRINNQGFRSDVDYAYDKPKDTVRILVLGDSFTLGHEVNQNETYSMIVEKKLKKKGISVEVMNAGVSGFSTAEELIYFEQEGIKYNPDILILGFYFNDLIDNIRSDLYKVVDNNLILNKKKYQPAIKIRDALNSFFIYRWLSENSYLHNYLNIVATNFYKKAIANKNSKIAINNSFENNQDDNFLQPSKEKLACKIIGKIYEIADNNNIDFIILDIPSPYRDNLPPSFPPLCSTKSVCDYYINSAELLKQYKGKDYLYRPHGRNHWTEISHAIVGERLSEIIENFIHEKI